MLKVVICGTYHRDQAGLSRLFRELETNGCRILSPLTLEFEDDGAAIVRSRSEAGFTAAELEKNHLRAISEADFVWFHCPDGHLGLSAAFELGYALAIGKPTFCYELPSDEMLSTQLTTARSVFAALETFMI